MSFDGLEYGIIAGRTCPIPLRVVVASDIRMLRDGIVMMLGAAGRSAVTVAGTTGLSATPQEIAAFQPDALLIDMSGAAGISMAWLGREALPDVKVIAFGLGDTAPAALACVRAGVAAFVSAEASVDEVIAATRMAVHGEPGARPLTADMPDRAGGMVTDIAVRDDARDSLTRREREIAMMLGDGLSNKQIARTLDIQCATVKNHVHSVLSKLRLTRRGEIAATLRHGHPAHHISV